MDLLSCVPGLGRAFYSCELREDRREIEIIREMVMFSHDYEDDLDILKFF